MGASEGGPLFPFSLLRRRLLERCQIFSAGAKAGRQTRSACAGGGKRDRQRWAERSSRGHDEKEGDQWRKLMLPPLVRLVLPLVLQLRTAVQQSARSTRPRCMYSSISYRKEKHLVLLCQCFLRSDQLIIDPTCKAGRTRALAAGHDAHEGRCAHCRLPQQVCHCPEDKTRRLSGDVCFVLAPFLLLSGGDGVFEIRPSPRLSARHANTMNSTRHCWMPHCSGTGGWREERSEREQGRAENEENPLAQKPTQSVPLFPPRALFPNATHTLLSQ